MAGGQRRDAHHVHIAFKGEARHFARRLEERADVDVEADIGEGCGDNLGAAVVTVLPHFGHQDARAAAFRLFKLLGHGCAFLNSIGAALSAE